MTPITRRLAALSALIACVLISCSSVTAGQSPATQSQTPVTKRPFVTTQDGRWIGNAICYGPHRDGQSPEGTSPNREQMLEDLLIISKHWSMLRMYGSRGASEEVLSLIRDEGLGLRVVLGAWVSTETQVDDQGQVVEKIADVMAANQAEVDTAVRLANEYPDIVAAITVGNESQVSWSFHKVQPAVLIGYIRQARAGAEVPVSTADAFSYWIKPESKAVADEVDFIVTHIYAMWNQQSFEDAMAWTQEQYGLCAKQHPGHTLVIGEAGWATRKNDQGDQGKFITAEANEDLQTRFYRDYIAWTTRESIPNFYFEAFDENWKGGDHPDEVEKHWGLFNADRTPKAVLQLQKDE